jgi:hypothetical protein
VCFATQATADVSAAPVFRFAMKSQYPISFERLPEEIIPYPPGVSGGIPFVVLRRQP